MNKNLLNGHSLVGKPRTTVFETLDKKYPGTSRNVNSFVPMSILNLLRKNYSRKSSRHTGSSELARATLVPNF